MTNGTNKHTASPLNFQSQGFNWKETIQKLAPVGYSLMAKRSVPREVQKDLLQDSLIILSENIKKEGFTLTSELSTYFYGICQRTVLAYFRKEKRNTHILDEYQQLHESAPKLLPLIEEEEDKLPTYSQIWEKIKTLGQSCFQVLWMFYGEKNSLEEIAEILEYKNTNTVKQAKHKCMN